MSCAKYYPQTPLDELELEPPHLTPVPDVSDVLVAETQIPLNALQNPVKKSSQERQNNSIVITKDSEW